MIFVDTSVLAAYYCPEPQSASAQAALEAAPIRVLSWLVEAELASVIARKVRTREFSPADGTDAQARFQEHLASGIYRRCAVGQAHFELATKWLSTFDLALQTLDALHLAVASGLACPLLTSDAALAKAASRLGLPVQLLSGGRRVQ